MKEGLNDTQTTLLRYAGFQDQPRNKRSGGFGHVQLSVLKNLSVILRSVDGLKFL